MKALRTWVDAEDYRAFVETSVRLGMTPSDSLRVFVLAFNEKGGYPWPRCADGDCQETKHARKGKVELKTTLEEGDWERFKETTARAGVKMAPAMRVFVSAFNDHKGFPWAVQMA